MTGAPSSVLKVPDFRRYLFARSLSAAGTTMTLIALPVLTYRESGSVALTAFVAGCEAAPYVIFGWFAGALTDRWNRRRTMVSADLLNACLVASVPVAYALGLLTIPHIVLVAFFGPAIGVFFDGAIFAALPTLIGRERLGEANSLAWAMQSVVEIVVPGLTGVLLAVIYPAWLLGFDAVTFLVAAWLILGIRRPLSDGTFVPPPLSFAVLRADVAEGLRFLWQHKGVRTMTILSFVQCWSLGGFIGLWVVWADQILGIGTEGWRFGAVWGVWATGQLVGSLLMARTKVPAARIILWAFPYSALAGWITSLITDWHWAAVGCAFYAAGCSAVFITAVTYRQQRTPEALLGRVNVVGRMFSWGMGWTIATAVSGLMAERVGLATTIHWFAASAFVGVVIAWLSPLRTEASAPQTHEASLAGS